ncbi:MAG: type II toxin-antitoxin system PemK/MazF family toxin [Candidatus Dormibacteria bacterium]
MARAFGLVIRRGEVWWADLGSPRGSAPALRRPVVIVSAEYLNRSEIRTVSVVGITSNVKWGKMPGNVVISAGTGGLRRDSIVNVTRLQTLDKADLDDRIGRLPLPLVRAIDEGLRRALEL